jgi:integrase
MEIIGKEERNKELLNLKDALSFLDFTDILVEMVYSLRYKTGEVVDIYNDPVYKILNAIRWVSNNLSDILSRKGIDTSPKITQDDAITGIVYFIRASKDIENTLRGIENTLREEDSSVNVNRYEINERMIEDWLDNPRLKYYVIEILIKYAIYKLRLAKIYLEEAEYKDCANKVEEIINSLSNIQIKNKPNDT